jgi:hypothetical protein
MSIVTVGVKPSLEMTATGGTATPIETIVEAEEETSSSPATSSHRVLAPTPPIVYSDVTLNKTLQIATGTDSTTSHYLKKDSLSPLICEIKSTPSDSPTSPGSSSDLDEKVPSPAATPSLPPSSPETQSVTIAVAATTTTTIETSSSWREGGVKGWLAVLGSLLMHSFVFVPTEFIFGIFALEYSLRFPSSSPSTIALIGTIGTSTTYLVGFVAGACSDRWGYRITACVGTVIMALSLVIASFSTQVRNRINCHCSVLLSY